MNKISDILNYLSPVRIIRRDDYLYIEDRRPTARTFFSGLAAIGLVLFAAYSLIFRPNDEIWLLGAGALVLAIVALFGTWREIYVFDKPRDTYTFTRQSGLKKDIITGSLSQFRAVQVEKRADDDSQKYMVCLLQQGLLLGQSDSQFLRENPPIFNTRAAEHRIAIAISKFLDIGYQGIVGDL